MITRLIGVELSDGDLEAIRVLYRARWSAELYNWKERDTDYCMWFVRIPDNGNRLIVETGQSLEETIYRLLLRLGGSCAPESFRTSESLRLGGSEETISGTTT